MYTNEIKELFGKKKMFACYCKFIIFASDSLEPIITPKNYVK